MMGRDAFQAAAWCRLIWDHSMSEERIKLEDELNPEEGEGQELLSPEPLDEVAGGGHYEPSGNDRVP